MEDRQLFAVSLYAVVVIASYSDETDGAMFCRSRFVFLALSSIDCLSLHRYMLIGPSVVLAMLTLSLFWIPVNSGERFMLGKCHPCMQCEVA